MANITEINDDSIDLISILRQIYKGRRLIIFSAILTFIVGIIIAKSIPNIYTAKTIFLPQTGETASTNLSGLASLTGLNIRASDSGSNVTPMIYPKIISSIPFKLELLDKYITIGKDSMTIREYYLKNSENESRTSALKRKILALPSMFLIKTKELFATKDSNVQRTERLHEISDIDKSLFKLIDSQLIITLNDKDGYITLEFSDRNKFAATLIARSAKNLLQEKIIAYRNQSSREFLDFVNKQHLESKAKYESLEDSIAHFKDKNINISSALYQNQLDRLVRKLNISFGVLEQLSKQVEEAKIQVNKDTPVFLTIEPVNVPLERSSPQRLYIVITWLVIGILVSIFYLLIKETIIGLIYQIFNPD